MEQHLTEKVRGTLVMTLQGNIVNFGVDNSSPPHAYNAKNDFLVLGEDLTYDIIMKTSVHEHKI